MKAGLAVQHYQRASDYYQLYHRRISRRPKPLPTMGFTGGKPRYRQVTSPPELHEPAARWVAYQHSINRAPPIPAAPPSWRVALPVRLRPQARIDSALRFARIRLTRPGRVGAQPTP